jgi:hypothetical protein
MLRALPTGLLKHLYMLDLKVPLEWTLLDDSRVEGTEPKPRILLGFAAAGGRLYVFGGENWSSEG